jgi:hypothetical protein
LAAEVRLKADEATPGGNDNLQFSIKWNDDGIGGYAIS